MGTTQYLQDINVFDMEGNVVEMELHQSSTGGLFAVDFTFIDQVGDIVHDPFTGEKVKLGEASN